jgi:16S rRNA processing protein RimM
MHSAYVLRLDACSTPEEAATLRGWAVKIPQGSAPPLPKGQYYEYELIGLSVHDETGQALGMLAEILETPGNHVLVVRGKDGEMLVPATKEAVVAVDLPGKAMTIRRSREVLAKEPARAAL